MINTIDSPLIYAGNDDNFTSLVLENSASGPVLLNFWSKKAGPCSRLYPVLDKVIHQFSGNMLLVNIDVDKEVKICKSYGIASVPTLKLIRHRDVQETLFGYHSESDLLTALSKYTRSKSDEALKEALTKYTQGELSIALEIIADAIVNDPQNSKLPEAMCKILMHEQRYKDAATLIDSLPKDIRGGTNITKLGYILGFHQMLDNTVEFDQLITQSSDNPENIKNLFSLCAHYVINQNYDQALKTLVPIIEAATTDQSKQATDSLHKILFILEEGHELTKKYDKYYN